MLCVRVFGVILVNDCVLCVGEIGAGLRVCVCCVWERLRWVWGMRVCCVWERLGRFWGIEFCCVWDSLVWDCGSECVLCVGQFGVGLWE